jgi:hypothetical protein
MKCWPRVQTLIVVVALMLPLRGDSQTTGRAGLDASDRVEVLLPAHPLVLGEPAEIALQIHGPGLAGLYIYQDQTWAGNHEVIEASGSRVPLSYGSDGRASITIIPLGLGTVTLHMTGRFPDGGAVGKLASIQVSPPEQRPKKLIVGQLGMPTMQTSKIELGVENDNRNLLTIYAAYDGVRPLVHVDPSWVTFRVTPDHEPAPMQINPQDGVLIPNHPGQALVEVSFGGRTDLLCIDVEQLVESGRSYYEKKCQQLITPGVKLGPQDR